MICIVVSMENCLYYDAIHDITVWLRTDSNSADINRFQSHTRKILKVNETNFSTTKSIQKKSRNLYVIFSGSWGTTLSRNNNFFICPPNIILDLIHLLVIPYSCKFPNL